MLQGRLFSQERLLIFHEDRNFGEKKAKKNYICADSAYCAVCIKPDCHEKNIVFYGFDYVVCFM